MRKIKTGDNVKVMRGKDAGKTGKVVLVKIRPATKMKPEKLLIVVEGVNKAKKHQKPNPTFNLPGGILEIERPFDASNVMLLDPKTNEPTRVGFRIDEKTGKKVRYAKKSNTNL